MKLTLSFKQYLDSKEQLRKAIEQTPIAINEYEVANYCNIVVGETEDEQQKIALKPKHKVVVEWRYDNINDPTIISVRIHGIEQIDETYSFPTFWTTKKLRKWLQTHTIEGWK